MKTPRFIWLILIMIFFSGKIFSQIYSVEEHWQLGLNIGATYFGGDLTDNKNKIWNNTPFNSYYYEDRKLMYGLTLAKEISPSVETSLQFLYGKVQGTKATVNMYFLANVLEINLQLKVNILNAILGENQKRHIDIYTVTGIGFAYFSSHSNYLQPDTNFYGEHYVANSYSGLGLLFPLGLGLKYDLGKRFRINLESSYRILLNDNLDALSYNIKKVEGYGFISLGFTYRFNFPRIYFKSRGRSNFVAVKKDVKLKKYKVTQTNGNVKVDKFAQSHNSGRNIYKNKRKKGFLGLFNKNPYR